MIFYFFLWFIHFLQWFLIFLWLLEISCKWFFKHFTSCKVWQLWYFVWGHSFNFETLRGTLISGWDFVKEGSLIEFMWDTARRRQFVCLFFLGGGERARILSFQKVKYLDSKQNNKVKRKNYRCTMKQAFGKIIGKVLDPCASSRFPRPCEKYLNKETFR